MQNLNLKNWKAKIINIALETGWNKFISTKMTKTEMQIKS